MNKKYILILKYLIIGINLTIIIGTPLLIINSEEQKRDFNCYISHVRECLDCNSKNLSYALCSGFCFEPREMDKEIFCVTHPEEDCFELPKECNF